MDFIYSAAYLLFRHGRRRYGGFDFDIYITEYAHTCYFYAPLEAYRQPAPSRRRHFATLLHAYFMT